MTIKAYWWRINEGREDRPNLGDDLGAFILSKRFGQEVKWVPPTTACKLLGCGSSLTWLNDGDEVHGSGCGSFRLQFSLGRTPRNVHVVSVRGPLSRQALLNAGIACPAVHRDPAMDLPLYFPRDVWPTKPLGIIPHCGHTKPFEQLPNFIDVRRPWREVVRDIWQYERIESSALHGLIVAEAYAIPARLVDPDVLDLSGEKFAIGFKHYDYFAATNRWPRVQRGFSL